MVWYPDGVQELHDDIIALSPAQSAGVMDSVFRLGRLRSLQWMDPVGYEGFVPVRQQLLCLQDTAIFRVVAFKVRARGSAAMCNSSESARCTLEVKPTGPSHAGACRRG